MKPPPNQKQKQKLETASVMFVPRTTGGTLIEKLRHEEEVISVQAGYKVKLMEKGGTKLGEMMIKSDPFSGSDCGREDCYQCLTKHITCKWTPCWRRNITYVATCLRCKDEEVTAQYHGESCNFLKARASSHMEKLKGLGFRYLQAET